MNAQGRKRKVADGDANAVPESETNGGEMLNPRSAHGFQVRDLQTSCSCLLIVHVSQCT